MLQADRLRRERGADPERQPAVSRLRLPARLFRLSHGAFSASTSIGLGAVVAPARGEDGRHRHRLRRGEAAARRGGPQGVLRPLRRAGRQSVRKDARPHSGPVQPVRVSRHPRSQPAARFRDEPGDPGVRPHSRRAAESSGRAALLGDGGAQRDRARPTRSAACRAAARSRRRSTARFRTMPAPTSSCRSASAPTPTRFCASRN